MSPDTRDELIAAAEDALAATPDSRPPCPTCGYRERTLTPVDANVNHYSGRTYTGPLVLIRCASCATDLAIYQPPAA